MGRKVRRMKGREPIEGEGWSKDAISTLESENQSEMAKLQSITPTNILHAVGKSLNGM